VIDHHQIIEIPFLTHSNLIFFYLPCSCLYAYVAVSTGHKAKVRFKLTIRLLPVLPGLIYFIYDKIYQVSANPEAINPILITIVERTIHAIGLLTFVVYFFLSCRLIIAYGKSLRPHSFGAERLRLYWLKTLLPLFMLPCFILFISVIGIGLPMYLEVFTNLILCLLIAYLFIRQFHFAGLLFETGKTKAPMHKYAHSSLNNEQLNKYANMLTDIMESKALYLCQDVCIEMVATRLNLTHHQLSQIVNQKFDKTFTEYINHYRIAYAKNLLNDSSFAKLKSSYIANQCGFKTREHFSISFKKIMGISLIEYVKRSDLLKRSDL